MSLQEHLSKPYAKLKRVAQSSQARVASFLTPLSASGTRRLQMFKLIGLLMGCLLLSWGALWMFFDHPNVHVSVESKKADPTPIESGSITAGTGKAWRYQMQTQTQKVADAVGELSKSFETFKKDKEEGEKTLIQDMETRLLSFESKLMERLEGQGSPGKDSFSQNGGGDSLEKPSIQKVTLNLTEAPKKLKTVDTLIPAGAFAKTMLLSGLDASASMNASADPRPMLLRLIDHGTLPRRFQSDLKDCHCTAGAFGDLSSERVYARLEKLTCIDKKTGEIIETQVAGYVAGSDGKAGIRGIVASKDGQLLTRSLIGGMFAGLSNVANPGNRQAMVNPFVPGGSANVKPPSLGEQFGGGMAQGATSALDRLSQYYIDRAEQLQPVIQIAAGQVIDIVFTEGTFIGGQSVRDDMMKAREQTRSSYPSPPPQPSPTPNTGY